MIPPVIVSLGRGDVNLPYWDLSEHGTVAFDRSFMQKCIGIGDAVFDDGGEFVGFDPSRNPGMLNVGVWLAFVPIAYRDDVAYGAMYPVWDRYLREKIDSTLVSRFVDDLRHWIATHVAPTDEPLPRLARFGNAFYDIGVRAAIDQRRISPAQADELMRAR